MVAWIALSTALGADDLSERGDFAAEVLRAEIARGKAGLSLPEAPPLYYLRYRLQDLGSVVAEASLGTLVSSSTEPTASLGVEVRVGSPQLDNTNFGGWQNGLDRTGLPDTYSASALQTAAWRLTDTAYKQAVEQFARKQAQFSPPPEYPGDFVVSEPVLADTGMARPSADPDGLIGLTTRLSGALRGDPVLLVGEVHLGHEAGSNTVVDSEGSFVRTPIHETSLRAVAATRAPDGGLVTDQLLVTVRDPSALPAEAALTRAVAALRDNALATAAAKPLEDEYVGPVIFEGQAAQSLFRHVLIPQLEGTPPEIPFDSFFGELGSDAGEARLGRRVLPPGFSVVADPSARPDHPGSFTYDAEGTPARRVPLVADGIVKDVLRSRVPTKDRPDSNGHARGSLGSRLEGRVAGLVVEPPRSRSAKALRKRALKLARAYGHDYVMVVRRIQEPSIVRLAGGNWFDEDGPTALPAPVAVHRVWADGREERLRGVSFASIQRWALRDIVDTGALSSGSFLAPFGGSVSSLGPTEGLPCWIEAPDVIVGEVELIPQRGDPRDVPLLPPPPTE